MYTLTLIYPDGSEFIVGGFPSEDAIKAWLTTEEAKPHWLTGTTTRVDDPPPPSEAPPIANPS